LTLFYFTKAKHDSRGRQDSDMDQNLVVDVETRARRFDIVIAIATLPAGTHIARRIIVASTVASGGCDSDSCTR
jgi:hypothetical protein